MLVGTKELSFAPPNMLIDHSGKWSQEIFSPILTTMKGFFLYFFVILRNVKYFSINSVLYAFMISDSWIHSLTPRFPMCQIDVFRPLGRDYSILRDRKISWKVSKGRVAVFLSYIEAVMIFKNSWIFRLWERIARDWEVNSVKTSSSCSFIMTSSCSEFHSKISFSSQSILKLEKSWNLWKSWHKLFELWEFVKFDRCSSFKVW